MCSSFKVIVSSKLGTFKLLILCNIRTYCSLCCKNNIIILIENENLLSPHLLYMVQSHRPHSPLLTHSLHLSHSSPSLSQLQKLHCPCSITLFSDDFFFLFTVLLYPQTEESRVVGLILGFFWNFWVSQWSVLPPRF